MPVETPSLFSRIIQEHLELKRKNAELDTNMPLARYLVDDPFSNHPLFKSEEQARLEDTMDGESLGDVTMLLDNLANDDTAEHAALPGATDAAAAAEPVAPAPGMLPNALPPEETAWGQSRDFDWGD
jgi:hypothetical protein